MKNNNNIDQKLSNVSSFIKDYSADNQRPPTVREIAASLGIKSTSSVCYYLKKLQQNGEISINSQLSRGIRFNSIDFSEYNFQKIPLLGEITAGNPIFADENLTDTFYFPKNLFKESVDIFMLKVSGSSMIDIGINDGDLLLVKKQNFATNGQVVAALIDNDLATIKRYINDDSGIRLHPENKHMDDIYPDNLQILGLVCGLIRTEVK